jgi:FkbM family methyltransferase
MLWGKRLLEKLSRRLAAILLPSAWQLPFDFFVATRVAGYEPEVLALRKLVSTTGGTALDIGANAGYWTYALAKARLFRDVIAVEPNISMLRNLNRASLLGLRIERCAMSDREGEAMLRIPVSRNVVMAGWATLQSQIDCDHESERTLLVPLKTIDSLGLTNLKFMKMDVEGHEIAALNGGVQTLKLCKPTCLIEVRAANLPTVDAFFFKIDSRYRRVDTASELGVLLTGENVMYRFE